MSQGLILMYHRITQPGPDPWGLRVTPEHLEEQLEVLQRTARPLPLRRLVQGLETQSLPPRSVAVTFDDGYADNLHAARPVLERHGIPATAYLVTGSLGGSDLFWWDELERILLRPGRLPPTLRLHLDGTLRVWELGDAAEYTEHAYRTHRGWRAGREAPSARQATYFSLWELLRTLPDAQRREAVSELIAWAGTGSGGSGGSEDYRPLTQEEVVTLADGTLVEIGAHSVTHPMLDALPAARQREEIEQSKASLEALVGERVESFAYPHGAQTAETAMLVQEAGYRSACATIAEVVRPDSDPYRLPRVHVEDWDGAAFEQQLSRWLSDS